MDHGSSAAAIAEAVCAIMMAKIVDHLQGHPNTKNVNHLEEQLGKILCCRIHHHMERPTWLPTDRPERLHPCPRHQRRVNKQKPPPPRPNKQIYQWRQIRLRETCSRSRPRCSLDRVVNQNHLPRCGHQNHIRECWRPLPRGTGGGLHGLLKMHHPWPHQSPPKLLVQNSKSGEYWFQGSPP